MFGAHSKLLAGFSKIFNFIILLLCKLSIIVSSRYRFLVEVNSSCSHILLESHALLERYTTRRQELLCLFVLRIGLGQLSKSFA